MKYPDIKKLVEDYLKRMKSLGLYPRFDEIGGVRVPIRFQPKVYSFTQTWSNTAGGFDRPGSFSGQAFIDEITTVVCEDLGKNIAVYFGDRFGYFLDEVQDLFENDVKNFRVKTIGDAKKYLIR